jgi:restriction system protein
MYKLKSVTRRFNDALSQLSWQDFERLLATYYAAQGYRVEHVGTGGSKTQFDGGIDLKLHRGDEYVVVQCKHWNARQVTHNAIHELLGVMLTQRATGAVVVTSGEFTQAAQRAANAESRVHLIDGATLRAMLGPLLPAQAPSPANDAASRYANAFTDAAPHRASPSSRRRRRARGRNPLPGIAFALIAGLITLYLVQSAISTFAAKATHPPAPVLAPVSPVRQAPTPSLPPSLPAPRQQPQHRPTTYSSVPTTDAEMQEWKRRNTESMKIIEKTTAEIPLR